MATVRDIVTDAMYAIGALGQGESLNATDGALCLRRFTRMIGTWANENLTVYDTTEGTLTLAGGTVSYSTTLLSSGRPVTIDSMFLRLSGIDYPITQVTQEVYDSFPYKAAQGRPSVYTYSPGYTAGTFYFYPTPDTAYVAHVQGRYPLMTGTITLETAVSLPPGYEAALCDNLAVLIAPSFGVAVSSDLRIAANSSKDALRSTNHVPLEMTSSLGTSGYVPGYIRILGDT